MKMVAARTSVSHATSKDSTVQYSTVTTVHFNFIFGQAFLLH